MMINSLYQEAHVWYTIPESVQENGILQRLKAILSHDELERHRRFHFPEDRHRYLVSHALVRTTLSKYLDIPPEDWCFSHGDHGRPEIANPGIPPLRFNLTHTTGLAGCVITLSNECGIDAEKVVERHNPSGVANRMFSKTEYQELLQLTGQEHLDYFFERWTLREAYVKARGIGISFPTRKLHFKRTPANDIQIGFHPDIEDREGDWQFELLHPTGEHIAAVAIRLDGENKKTMVTRFADMQELTSCLDYL